MDENRINKLADKFIKGTITDTELQELEGWFGEDDLAPVEVSSDADESNLQYRIFSKIAERGNLQAAKEKNKRRWWPRIAVAASILAILSFGAYFLKHQKNETPQQVAQVLPLDATPGTNSATLTLGNGQKIVLNTKANGQIAVQGGSTINKTATGEIVYAANANNNELVFNTVATMRKEKYKLTLADGTNVWLNAASSIRYPTTFNGNQREVQITGEAYFEVAHNPNKPFLVTSNGQTIEVLGTHFNVNAYNDEPEMRTTLLEGSVKIKHNGQTALLKPGQQGTIRPTSDDIKVGKANTQQAVAWKDDQFMFKNTELKPLMRQIARWYDLDIVYQGNVPNDEFNGQMPRAVNLSKMLRILESGDVHFRIVNEDNKKKLIITP